MANVSKRSTVCHSQGTLPGRTGTLCLDQTSGPKARFLSHGHASALQVRTHHVTAMPTIRVLSPPPQVREAKAKGMGE